MNAAEITAICTGIPAIIGAVTALIVALRASKTAKAANVKAIVNYNDLTKHMGEHS